VTLPTSLAAFPALDQVRWLALGIVGCTGYWALASLVVSHWIYDRSKLNQWSWIKDLLPQAPKRWVNIHVGLDESSTALKRMFPESESVILDVFDSTEMTEPSISEARCVKADTLLSRPTDFRSLPFKAAELDAVFLIFAAHEIRKPLCRLALFKEAHRVLKPGGRALLVEHLRDLNNFLAFGPGCFHFHSRAAWLDAAKNSGFAIEREERITPFAGTFLLRRPV
jgi:SAM-dependent methyltransferase